MRQLSVVAVCECLLSGVWLVDALGKRKLA
jgi:hypothetical protein